MRIVALDLVRFIAAISVVLYHYVSRSGSSAFPALNEVTKFGYLGVPLFFIISGYVIALSATSRTAIEFGINRFVRLYPTLWACVLFTATVTFLVKSETTPLLKILANFTLVNEYIGFTDIDGVYWTLKAELKFYACILFLIFFRVFDRIHIWLTIWIILVLSHIVTGQPFFLGWFITPGYSSFFIAGVAFYSIKSSGPSILAYLILILSLLISGYKSYFQVEGYIYNPSGSDRVISVLLIFSFYTIFFFLFTRKIEIRPNKLVHTLGSITYPLYLVHNSAGVAIIDKFSDTIPEEILILITIVIMIIVSWLIYRFIDQPISNPLKRILLSLFKGSKLQK